ncbi:hypothetical protein B0A48_00843 [Cryoendolithus antarcticus]|uniref:DUF4048 domain-containing protein n=1 Tax=Cryoendolithus antarcticus TaxID=1507870 RepID=A0A1V8TRQ0_9PEZI|nr:hypothetical protein B0A48_00843 [Cryoendolithus antarcticus]
MSNEAPRRALSVKSRPLEVMPISPRKQNGSSKTSFPERLISPPASPSTSTHSAETSSIRSFQSHGRSMSMATDFIGGGTPPIRPNRFSVTFPIHPLPATREQSPQRLSMSPTREALPVLAESVGAAPTGPTDSNFLTAIAAQERRVLELKEEMQRAEAELNKLKRQWAAHEAHKKKNDARKVTKLQPLNTAPASPDRELHGDRSDARAQQEMARRKSLLNGTKTSSRTVFEGSRHARTLSLLSPVHSNGRGFEDGSHPPRQDSLTTKRSLEADRPRQLRPSLLSRASTTPDMTTEVAKKAIADIDLTNSNVDRDVLIKTGKKMASDFKDGLWTFLEDLRQATVGEEATQNGAQGLRKQTSTQTLRRGKQTASRTSLRPSSRGSTTSKASSDTKRPNTRSPVRTRQKPSTTTRPTSVVEVPESTTPLVDIGTAPLTEAGLPIPQETPPQKRQSHKHCKSPSTTISTTSSADAWDTWDDSQIIASPTTARRSSSSATSRESGVDGLGIKAGEKEVKKDPIPWPALAKFGPATLRRTASHLMSEWERSLTPEPGKDFKGEEHEVVMKK